MKKRSPLVKYIFWSTAVFLVIICFLKRDNLITWIKAGVTINRQENRIEYLQKENADLDKQIKSLSTDRDTLEKFAREKFYFAEPGDDVYVLE